MNKPYEARNKLVKHIVLTSALLLEYFQWGKQSESDKTVKKTIAQLEQQIAELKEILGND